MSESIEIDVYYDYACPYVYAGATWLKQVKAQLGDQLIIHWRYFPLEQVNSAEGPDWKLWEQPLDAPSRGRPAFHAAIAARRQGEDAFERFHYGLLHAKHIGGQNHGRRSVLNQVAEEAGLDMERFATDMEDGSLLAAIETDYEHGRQVYGVFGTPTLVFPNGEAAYVKMLPPAPDDEALEVWKEVSDLVQRRSYLAEIKRPTPPADH